MMAAEMIKSLLPSILSTEYPLTPGPALSMSCMSLMIFRTRTCSCSPGDVSDGSAPDVALVTEGLGPVQFVSLQPPGVHAPVELVVLVSFGQVSGLVLDR